MTIVNKSTIDSHQMKNEQTRVKWAEYFRRKRHQIQIRDTIGLSSYDFDLNCLIIFFCSSLKISNFPSCLFYVTFQLRESYA